MDTFTTRFLTARRAVIDMSLSDLNTQQRQAAEAADGPLLILAGAAAVFLAGKLAGKRYPDRKEARERLTVWIKAGGCAVLAAGAAMILI